MAKERNKLEAAARELGYEFHRYSKGGHRMYRHTVTGKMVTIASTPSDHRGFKNALSLLRSNAK